MTTATMDPALRKLLDNLPTTDPDAAEPQREFVEVWLAFCEWRRLVPVGVPCAVDFGEWHGPQMASSDILLHIRSLRDGKEYTTHITGWEKPIVRPGNTITIERLLITYR